MKPQTLLLVATFALVTAVSGTEIVCYVASWTNYYPGDGKFGIKDIVPEHCTHLIYAFAGLDPESWKIRPLDPWIDIDVNGTGYYKMMTQLRQNFPELKVSLAIGGWNEGSKNYSLLAANSTNRQVFAHSVVDYLSQYNFTGFDLDWEFPSDRGGDLADKKNFVALVKDLKDVFKGQYTLSAAISANKNIINKGYDLPELSKLLDHIHVMTYDYHGSWDKKVLPNAPLRSKDGSDVESTINHLLKNGASPRKLVLGLPFYGRTCVLVNALESPSESPIGKPCMSNFAGPYSREAGFMGYNEICHELSVNATIWKKGWDAEASIPYAVQDKRVIVYDDPESIAEKVKLMDTLQLGGVMIWTLSTDDFRGKCSGSYPLMKRIQTEFKKLHTTTTSFPGTTKSNKNFACTLCGSYILLCSVFALRHFLL